MSRVRVVTDSAAAFQDEGFAEANDVTVVPLDVHLGNQVFRDGIDIDAAGLFNRMKGGAEPPRVVAPPVSMFETLYEELSQETDQIIVVTHSQHLTPTYDNAQTARGALLGRCEIVVVDSRSAAASQGFLVEAATQAAAEGQSLEDVVRVARGAVHRIYAVFYVDTLDTIQREGLIGETQALLGAMLDIKPLLTIEDGLLITMEKARTHAQAIDKMIEFVTEFTDIERLCILQNTLRTTELTRMVQDRLALEFSWLQTPVMLYGPLMASRLGPDAMGLAILEGASGDLSLF